MIASARRPAMTVSVFGELELFSRFKREWTFLTNSTQTNLVLVKKVI